MGILYIVATPIGNMKDISLRAIRTLFKVNTIACEDTRRTGLLLAKILPLTNQTGEIIKKPQLISYYEQNELQRIPEIINLLKSDCDVALVSDAGMPAISDPGFKLIRECARENIKVEVIPGASSVITALAISALPTDKFTFLGYLPHKASHAKKLLENVVESLKLIKSTIILFEAPHKLLKTLELMKEILGEDREIVICRELTKIHEEVIRNNIKDVLLHFQKTKPLGEIVILFS